MKSYIAGLGRLVVVILCAAGMNRAGAAEQPFAQSLFNGKDLSGWNVEAGDFHVEDGKLVLDGGSGWLRSDWPYDNFAMHVEWRAVKAGYDSGIYFKAGREGSPWPKKAYQLQLGQGGEGSVGSLVGAAPKGTTILPPGQWNHFDLLCQGRHAELKINGKPAWMSDDLDPRAGFVGIQAEGYRIEFRNWQITELNFTPLFNGKNLDGWEAVNSPQAWKVQDGLLYCAGGGGGWLSTAEEYKNFVLRLEFKVPEGGNSGVFIRAPRQGDGAYVGMELQVLDDYAKQYAELRPTQYTGAIYDVVQPTQRVTKKAGQWNQMEIRADGRHVQVVLNGTQTVDANLEELKDHYEKHPGLTRSGGYIGLQNHGSRLDYRNHRIQGLP